MIRLYPQPESLQWKKGWFLLPPTVSVQNAFDNEPLSRELKRLFGLFSDAAPVIVLQHEDLGPETYRIVVDDQGVTIGAAGFVGALYAVHMLSQLMDKKQRRIPCVAIVDGPKLALRGVMLDISRNKIPTLETLTNLLPVLAQFRVNHLELYVEGFSMESKTFPDVHLAYPPFTIQMFQALETEAAKYGIELVGNQNSFGHMTEWLKRPECHDLAECPDGFVQWGYPFPASTLNPTDPRSLAFVKKLLDGFVPYTKSNRFNLNCDEPFELGRGRSQTTVAEQGVGVVYWTFVSQLIDHLRAYGKQAMLWGDVLIHHPELMDRIPKDTIFLDWGYDRGYPFMVHAALLETHGVAFVTCPGTSTWNSFAGRHRDMTQTTVDAAQAAIAHGGLGTMTTDWGDFGHLQYLPASFWGFATLGAAAWSGRYDEMTIREYLDRHVFQTKEGSIASILYDLANIQTLEPQYVYNGTALFRSVQFVGVDALPIEIKAAVHKRVLMEIPFTAAHAEAIRSKLTSIRRRLNAWSSAHPEQPLFRDELMQTVRFMTIALEVNRIVTDPSHDTEGRRKRVIRSIEQALQEHRRLWQARNMDSTYEQSALRWSELARILAATSQTVL